MTADAPDRTLAERERADDPAAGAWVTAAPAGIAGWARRFAAFPSLLAEHRDLIATSVRRDLAARFTGTLLGWFWPLVHPVFLFAVYYFIFTKLLAMKLPPEAVEGREAALGVFMFVGVLVWSAFSESLQRCCTAITDNGNLIKKLAFPSELLPLNACLASAVTMLFGLLVFLAACALTPVWRFPSPAALAWVPLLALLQVAFAYGLGLLLATLHVFLRDTAQLAGLGTTVWMFLTPLFWIPELPGIRESVAPYLDLVRANPMYHSVYAWRWVLMSAEPSLAFPSPLIPSISIFAAWALGAFALGYTAFVLGQRRFADEV
jgi:ABC-type polysaccharide/polyol phosphate export permease